MNISFLLLICHSTRGRCTCGSGEGGETGRGGVIQKMFNSLVRVGVFKEIGLHGVGSAASKFYTHINISIEYRSIF